MSEGMDEEEAVRLAMEASYATTPSAKVVVG
jgi:hypothetical protein